MRYHCELKDPVEDAVVEEVVVEPFQFVRRCVAHHRHALAVVNHRVVVAHHRHVLAVVNHRVVVAHHRHVLAVVNHRVLVAHHHLRW